MAVSPSSADRVTVAIDRIAPVAVPVGLAVLTWLALLLIAGFFARLGSLSLLNLVPLFFVALLVWPVYSVAPWREGATARVRAWAAPRRPAFVLVAVLGALPLVPVVPDLVVSVLQLPYRGAGSFYGASLFYRERFGRPAGWLLLTAAQSYLQVLWLYFLSVGLLGLVRRVR